MKLKSLLISLSASAIALGATAQSHHGFYWQPSMQDFNDFMNPPATANEINALNFCMNSWFTPELTMPIVKADGTLEESNIYADNKTDLMPRFPRVEDNASILTGVIVTPAMENGYMTVTIPDELEYPYYDSYTEKGVMLFHCVLGSKSEKLRINDANNTLSATGDRAYLKDCTGVYAGIQAPAGATVKVFLSTPNISEANLGGYGTNPNLYDKMQTIVFDFDVEFDGTYKEFTSGKPYNALAGIELNADNNAKWPDGYCVKFIDVAVYGVKAGDKVGFGGVQSLHEGWTPKEFVEGWSAGVDAIGVDNADAPVEYFNIQGVRVSADNLTPGLYIKRQGTEATKVLVK